MDAVKLRLLTVRVCFDFDVGGIDSTYGVWGLVVKLVNIFTGQPYSLLDII